jgi:hypothetical protein
MPAGDLNGVWITPIGKYDIFSIIEMTPHYFSTRRFRRARKNPT